MLQVSRDSNLKIPKKIETIENNSDIKEEQLEIRRAIALANNQKCSSNDMLETMGEDSGLKIPFNSNDLIVITKMKKLCAYVITITEKSPKKYRGVFVNRMQNYCLAALEDLLQANFIRMDSSEKKNKKRRISKASSS